MITLGGDYYYMIVIETTTYMLHDIKKKKHFFSKIFSQLKAIRLIHQRNRISILLYSLIIIIKP